MSGNGSWTIAAAFAVCACGSSDAPASPSNPATSPPAAPGHAVTHGLGPALTVSLDNMGVCALLASGHVACWGEITDLTTHQRIRASRPQLIDGVADAVELHSAQGESCVRRKTGPITCWSYGELEPMRGSEGALAFAHGQSGWCILTASHTIACRTHGAADGFVPVPGFTGIKAIGREIFDYRCAVKSDGHVLCAGDRSQLGLGAGTEPATVPGITDAVDIAVADGGRVCATRRDGTLSCIAREKVAALPARADQVTETCIRAGGHVECQNHPMFDDDFHPIDLPGDASDLSCAGKTCCAVVAGAVVCWGDNHGGQLADGVPIDHLPPAKVEGLPPIAAIDVGDHTFARTASGKLYSWGGGLSHPGHLLDGVSAAFPFAVHDEDDVNALVGIAATGRELRTVSAWYIVDSSIAADDKESHEALPRLPADLRDLLALTPETACVALADGTTRCTNDDHTAWTRVPGMQDVTKLALAPVGDASMLVGLTRGGAVLVHEFDGAPGARSTAVPGIKTARELAGPLVGLANGSVVRLDTDDNGKPVAEPVPSLAGITHLGFSLGGELVCGIAAGHVKCGQSAGSMGLLSPDVGASALSVGGDHACAIDPAGAVWCWGSDLDAGLGRGRKVYRSEPAKVLDIGP